MDLIIDILVVLFFTFIGGFFSAIEMAFVTLRTSQINQLKEAGDKRSLKVVELANNPNRFLSAGQIGVTVSGFLSASFGAATIVPFLEPFFKFLPFSQAAIYTFILVLVTLIISYLSLVFGELVPKRLALANPSAMARFTIPFIDTFSYIVKPIVWLLSHSTNIFVKLSGGNPEITKDEITTAELKTMVLGHDELPNEEKEILSDIFEASEKTVQQVMKPRTDVIFLEADDKIIDIIKTLSDAQYTRYPVIDDDIDDVKGFVHIRDLLLEYSKNPKTNKKVIDFVRQFLRIPGTSFIMHALASIKNTSSQIALVVDEYGGTDGIVTLEDILEEFVGEIYDEYDKNTSDARFRKTDGTVFLDGHIDIEDFFAKTGVKLEDGPYETLAGYIIFRLGRLAKVNDEIIFRQGNNGIKLVVSKTDHHRIVRVKILGLDILKL
ncbi:MAG: hemolysin family protein [Bifidobacteriaceae bacterium]|jgi:putative hemolysin|nr:hemolysin family protein [Bifidobacteriaceae bacterium]